MKPFPIKTPFTLAITQTDIDEGLVCDRAFCPAALALHRLLPEDESGPTHVSVESLFVFINEDWAVILPAELENWIIEFDKDQGPPDPIAVEIPTHHVWDQETFCLYDHKLFIGQTSIPQLVHAVQKKQEPILSPAQLSKTVEAYNQGVRA